jgi:transcription-repair coupling factor (superfamily II helicase)
MNIPADYVRDKSIRLGLYRRLAGVISFNEVNALLEEFTDRFGPPPVTVRNLFFQLEVKLYCEQIGLSTLTTENGQIVMRYPDEEIPQNLPDLGAALRIGKTALWMPISDNSDWRGDLMTVLRKISRE